LEDHFVVADLTEAKEQIRSLMAQPDFSNLHHDQSLGEIAVMRITSAVLESGSIETAAPSLVALLQVSWIFLKKNR